MSKSSMAKNSLTFRDDGEASCLSPLPVGLDSFPARVWLSSLPLPAWLGALPLPAWLGALPLPDGVGSLPLPVGVGSLPVSGSLFGLCLLLVSMYLTFFLCQ